MKEIIAKEIIAIRKKKGLNQTYVASRIGCSRQSYAHLESGKFSQGIEMLSKVGDILGFDVKIVERK